MTIHTSKITGSAGAGIIQLSGTIEALSFVSAVGVGNSSSIDATVTVPSNYNSVLFGPITITETLTITSTAAVKIKDIADA